MELNFGGHIGNSSDSSSNLNINHKQTELYTNLESDEMIDLSYEVKNKRLKSFIFV